MAFNWTCPHCNRAQSVTDNRFSVYTGSVGVSDLSEGTVVMERLSIGCANPDCGKLTLHMRLGLDAKRDHWKIDEAKPLLFSERLLPRGASKPQPEYIPRAIVEDYAEACLIRDLSPKASATLTRRCLQGMIRDFCGISKARLIDEIKELRAKLEDGSADRSISPESVDAIDHVRSIGNIGAHMEKDINTIVPVDADEAAQLIGLVELLFEEWYGARHERQTRLKKIAELKVAKDALKQGNGATEVAAE